MSHYIYKKKAFIELPDGRMLPLCLYADSSISDYHYDMHGRKHWFHPKSWCVNTMGAGGGILVKKQEFHDAVKQAYEKEMQYLRGYRDKYDPEAGNPDGDSYSYYGTVYPGGGKMKHMKSFYSTRRTIPAEKFLRENRFSIRIMIYEPKSFKTVEEQHVFISTVDDLIRAEEVYGELCKKASGHMCVGIYGLDGAD